MAHLITPHGWGDMLFQWCFPKSMAMMPKMNEKNNLYDWSNFGINTWESLG